MTVWTVPVVPLEAIVPLVTVPLAPVPLETTVLLEPTVPVASLVLAVEPHTYVGLVVDPLFLVLAEAVFTELSDGPVEEAHTGADPVAVVVFLVTEEAVTGETDETEPSEVLGEAWVVLRVLAQTWVGSVAEAEARGDDSVWWRLAWI